MPMRPGGQDRRDVSRAAMREGNYAPPELVREISQRLRTVCAHLHPTDFDALVQRIAHVKWKYDQRNHIDRWYDQSSDW